MVLSTIQRFDRTTNLPLSDRTVLPADVRGIRLACPGIEALLGGDAQEGE
jgi:hypothetical protein